MRISAFTGRVVAVEADGTHVVEAEQAIGKPVPGRVRYLHTFRVPRWRLTVA